MQKVPPAQPSPGEDVLSRLRIVSRALDEPTHPLTASLLAFWRAGSVDGHFLERRAIPCRALSGHLPFLHLYEAVDADGSDWRCRLVGAGIVERYNFADRRGMTLLEAGPPEIAARRAERYRIVTATGKPAISRGRIMNIGRDFYELEVIHLPVSPRNGRPNILGGMFFFER